MNSQPSLLTVEETAQLLRISGQGVRRMLAKKLIPAIRVMGSIRIDRKDVLMYVEKQRRGGNENELAKKYGII